MASVAPPQTNSHQHVRNTESQKISIVRIFRATRPGLTSFTRSTYGKDRPCVKAIFLYDILHTKRTMKRCCGFVSPSPPLSICRSMLRPVWPMCVAFFPPHADHMPERPSSYASFAIVCALWLMIILIVPVVCLYAFPSLRGNILWSFEPSPARDSRKRRNARLLVRTTVLKSRNRKGKCLCMSMNKEIDI